MDIVIIEDELPAAEKLSKMILKYDPKYHIIQKLRSVEASIDWLRTYNTPDLIFMDIHLLDGTCFDILNTLSITCPVIFTTAYDSYALEAFQLNSIAYLLKPVSFTKLQQAFHKLKTLQTQFQLQHQLQQLAKTLTQQASPNSSYKSRFLVKLGSKMFSISADQIQYFLSDDRITFLITNTDKKYPVNPTLNELEQTLDPNQFFRINRQMILNYRYIQVVHKYFKGRLKVELRSAPKEEIIVSSRRVADFQEWLDR